jgi:hypothetical protein
MTDDPNKPRFEVPKFVDLLHDPDYQPGRKTKCTPELTELIARIIAEGALSTKDACALIGLPEATFYSWQKRGIAEVKRLNDAYGDTWDETDVLQDELPFFRFAYAVKRAVPYRKLELLQRIKKAGEDSRNWTANAWLLERIHTNEFGRHTRVEMVDWRADVVKLIIERKIEFEELQNELGYDESEKLFIRAGVPVPASRKSDS